MDRGVCVCVCVDSGVCVCGVWSRSTPSRGPSESDVASVGVPQPVGRLWRASERCANASHRSEAVPCCLLLKALPFTRHVLCPRHHPCVCVCEQVLHGLCGPVCAACTCVYVCVCLCVAWVRLRAFPLHACVRVSFVSHARDCMFDWVVFVRVCVYICMCVYGYLHVCVCVLSASLCLTWSPRVRCC